MTEENPYESPAAAAPVADRNLLRVRSGLHCLQFGFLLELFGLFPELLVVGSFDSELVAQLVALTFVAQPLGTLITIVGTVMLLDAPVESRAKSLLWVAVLGNVAMLGLLFVMDEEVNESPLELLSFVAGMASWICLILFLRQLALYFGDPRLARECLRLVILAIAGFASIAIVFASYWLAMLLLVGVALYVTWRYLRLLLMLTISAKSRIAALAQEC